MVRAKVRADLVGSGIPVYSLREQRQSYLVLDELVMDAYECEDLGGFSEYNMIITVKGVPYFINSIDLDFVVQGECDGKSACEGCEHYGWKE